jgi:hypothetical protein
MSATMEKSDWLSVPGNRHRRNRTLSAELDKLYSHRVGKCTQAALFHHLESLF